MTGKLRKALDWAADKFDKLMCEFEAERQAEVLCEFPKSCKT
jgi:hypothetical protein